jgi:hypothetical protein
MPATITVTGTTGPAMAVTAAVFAGVTEFHIDAVKNLLSFKQDSNPVRVISIEAAITVTATKAGNVWTLVVANT